jgi:hypothetical protein
MVAGAVSLFDRKPDARALADYIRDPREEIFQFCPAGKQKPASAQGSMRVLLLRDNLKRILAERRGFEPRLGLTLNTLSRRAT